jgi:cysteine-rich repeat protein
MNSNWLGTVYTQKFSKGDVEITHYKLGNTLANKPLDEIYCQGEAPVCGNGKVESKEACDGGEQCSSDCKTKCADNEVWKNGKCEVPAKPPVCGDNFLDTGEVCDDGNTVNGDQCSSTCQNKCEGEEVWDGGKCMVTPKNLKPSMHPIQNVNNSSFGIIQGPNNCRYSHCGIAAVDIASLHSWPVSWDCLRGMGMPIYATMDGIAYVYTSTNNTVVHLQGYTDKENVTYEIHYAHLTSQSLEDYANNISYNNSIANPQDGMVERVNASQVKMKCDTSNNRYNLNKNSYPIDVQNYSGDTLKIFYNSDGSCKGEIREYDMKYQGSRSYCSLNVKKGSLIGFLDNTGYSGGPHLHYEIFKNGSSSVNDVNICDGFGIDCNDGF